jgi:hypothetical protein
MKYMKKAFLFLVIVISFEFANSQVIQSLQFTKGSLNDGAKLMQAYLLPVENSFNGINHSGLIHSEPFINKQKKYAFKITVDFMGVTTPTSDKTYDVNKLQLEEFKPSDPNKTIAQTFAGNENTIQLESESTYRVPSTSFPFYTTKPILTFNTPKGVMSTVPFAAIGFVLSTPSSSFKVRGLTPYPLSGMDGKIFHWGISAQTKINKLLTFLKSFPIDIIVSGGVERMQLSVNPNLKPQNSTDKAYDNQEFFIHSTAFPLQLALSKCFSERFSAFVSGGYNIANSNTGLVGTYPIYKSDPTDTYNIAIDKINDPIKYSRNNSNAFFNLGVGYQLKRIGFSGELSLAKYQSFDFRININL